MQWKRSFSLFRRLIFMFMVIVCVFLLLLFLCIHSLRIPRRNKIKYTYRTYSRRKQNVFDCVSQPWFTYKSTIWIMFMINISQFVYESVLPIYSLSLSLSCLSAITWFSFQIIFFLCPHSRIRICCFECQNIYMYKKYVKTSRTKRKNKKPYGKSVHFLDDTHTHTNARARTK